MIKNPYFHIQQNIQYPINHYSPMKRAKQKFILMCRTSIVTTGHGILFTWTCKSRAIMLPVSRAGAAAGGARRGVRFASKDNANEGQKY